jgi:hypothetical protein
MPRCTGPTTTLAARVESIPRLKARARLAARSSVPASVTPNSPARRASCVVGTTTLEKFGSGEPRRSVSARHDPAAENMSA